jgi:hypothetical protein
VKREALDRIAELRLELKAIREKIRREERHYNAREQKGRERIGHEIHKLEDSDD